jgi:hypothetical protein
MSWELRSTQNTLTVLFVSVLGIVGCGTPGAPLPPSLNLPDRVRDLSAERAGDRVTLTWTMPKRNTDKLALIADVPVHVCRREGAGDCAPAGELVLAPGSDGIFSEALPSALATGSARALSYFVELKNRNGRSAGPSDPAAILAGQAPAAVSGLAAEVRKAGVVLHWTPDNSASAMRLHRKLLTLSTAKTQKGLLAPPHEPAEKSLFVEDASAIKGRALDSSVVFGMTYEYRAQRVARAQVDGQTLELPGEISAPIRVAVLDVFPPATPTGLAAVATASASGMGPSIDLSWQPVADADLAGYRVYRREGQSPWQPISDDQPLVAPAFHDSQVASGHAYIYAVSAVDQGGHESGRSDEARETVPNP